MATTFRSDVVAKVLVVLNAEKTANPTFLRAVYSTRPGSFPETPCAYVGNRDEDITHDAGTRTRTMSGLTVVVVDTLLDPLAGSDRMDDLIDRLVDRFTDAYAISGGGGLLQQTGVRDTDIILAGDTGTSLYRGSVLTFGGTNPTFVMEGRT